MTNYDEDKSPQLSLDPAQMAIRKSFVPSNTELSSIQTSDTAPSPTPIPLNTENTPRKMAFRRAHTNSMLVPSEDYLVPQKVVERKPTIKKEVSFFYSLTQTFGALKRQLVDKGVERTDALYNWFWNIGCVVGLMQAWERWEQIPVFGHFLQMVRLFLNTRAVLFFPCFPAGLACYQLKQDYAAVVLLFLALMYFAKVLSNTTEIAAEHFGPVIGALMNATMGNLVELIISGTTVSKDDATLTITNLIGSMVSNNLFVNGTCSFFGGLDGKPIVEKKSMSNNLVFMTCISLLLCAMSVMGDIDTNISDEFKRDTSQVVAALIFINYLVFLVLSTNEDFKKMKVKKAQKADEELLMAGQSTNEMASVSEIESDERKDDDLSDEKKEELPSKIVCFGALALCIAGLGPTGNFFVETLKDLTDDKPISKVFIGLIILPLAGSLPEHVSSIVAAHKGNMDLSMTLTVGSSNQILGFVLPIIQFISSKYPSTNFHLYLEDYVAAYVFITAFISAICLTNAMSYGVNLFHGTVCLTTFAVIVCLTFAND